MAAKLIIIAVYYALVSRGECFQQQSFRVVPKNTRVHEGGEAVLECEIANLAGQVQWAKDGFALGFASIIPGYPRFMMVGDRRHGVYNLRISNATLDDDAEYQCQVGPAQMHRVIRANASLTVISPPTSVEIVGHQSNSKLEIQEGRELTLECLVRNAKPAARIVWYRGNVELKIDRREDDIIEIEGPGGSRKVTRYTVRSRIHMKPTSDDDYAEFTCEARHEALQRDLPMRTTVQLSVLYPPGAPYIEGYAEGETVRRGQTLELVCRSRGGNPPAQLIWYKNGEQIRMAYRTAGRLSENVLTFTADASDNKARYRCEAKNIMISNTLKAEIDLTVLFAPTHVTISGPSEARVGDPVPLTCATAPSNPPAEIKWMVVGKHFRNATSRTVMSPEGGWITSSNITVTVEPNRRALVVVCHGLNMQLTENVVSTHTINVLYPPSEPIITGYQSGMTLAAGSVQQLMCISNGGNPLATLTWYKNDKKIHSQTKVTDKSVTSQINILTNVTDNLAHYRCEAANSATEIPLFKSVTLNVHFAPEAVKIHVEPPELKPGDQASLICDAASSNPPASLSWWKDGIPVHSSPTLSKPGLHGGTVSTIELKLNVSKEMNGAVYTCQALNEALQRSVHDAHTLKVLYPPIFEHVTPETTVGVEGDPLIIILKADGNPIGFSYTWTKDGLPITQSTYSNENDRIISDGSMLNITKLSRHDAGIYSCEAVNSQGAALLNITVNVHYPATIKSVSRDVMVNPNDNATLHCYVTGNPLSEENITWRRKGYKDMAVKTNVSYNKNGTSFLHIQGAKRSDVGNFQCVANNGIGNSSVVNVMLVVKFKPEMDTSAGLVKSASNVGDIGRLTCKCKSAPAPHFTWSRNGATLPTNTTGKYYAEYHRLDAITYSSVLLVDHVTSADYGQYECAARNDIGFTTNSIKLDITSAPDQVISLKVTNVTHNSVSLLWVPGFDGGMQPSYRIRYRNVYEDAYKYEDIVPINSTTYTVTGLDLGTDYVFSIMAINKLGQSKYRPDDVKATTLTTSEIGELREVPSDLPRMVIVYVSITAAVLVIINIGLISCFIMRRRTKRLKEQAGAASKSATIEMYAPSSYNDTMTGETLSSVSEKSETYSNDEELQGVLHHSMHRGHGGGLAPPPIPEVPSLTARHGLTQSADPYLLENTGMIIPPPALDYPPPNYNPYDAAELHARTLPHPHHRHNKDGNHSHTLNRNSAKQAYVNAPSPMPPLDGSYYNMSSDRYLSYPPMINEYLHQTQLGRTPTPPHQYLGTPHAVGTHAQSKLPAAALLNGGAGGAGGSPPPNYNMSSQETGGPNSNYIDRQSAGGTLRRQRAGDKISTTSSVPPPDVTVLHGTCNQKQTRSPQTPGNIDKQPQSILKDPSRHKQYQYQHGSPLSSSTPISNNSSNQILTVQNLAVNDGVQSGIPAYGTIKKENKKNSVSIDESNFSNKHDRETHVV